MNINVAGPSRLHPPTVPVERDRDDYEGDLARMIAGLDLTDIERIQGVHETRLRQGRNLSDREFALRLLLQNVQENAQLDADRAIALALQEDSDGEPAPATRVQQPEVVQVAPQPATRNAEAPTQTWGQWFASFFTTPLETRTSNPNQVPTITARVPRRATGHDCVICQDPIFGAEVRAPCGHYYDIGCVTDLFQAATRDESLYPPRCCRQSIPLPQVRPHLTQTLFAEFEDKALEFGTLKRVYCSTPACSRFLGPLHDGFFSKFYTCTSPTCAATTCAKCRGKYEGRAHSCTTSGDAETEQVLTLGRTSGWSRCPGCSQMIELNMGCFHMTCRCRTEFCYLCRALWKNCRCPQWDEHRLFAAAEQRVDAQLHPARRVQPANPPQQAPAVGRPAPAAGLAWNQPVIPHRHVPAVAARPVPIAQRVPAVAARAVPVAQQVPVVAARPVPVANARPVNPPQQVPVPAMAIPRRTPVINTPPTPVRAGTSARVPASVPLPYYIPARPAEANGRVSSWSVGVPEPQTTSATPRRAPVANIPTPVRAEAPARVPEPVLLPYRTPARRAEADARLSDWFARGEEPQTTSTTDTVAGGNTVRDRMIRETMERLRVDHDCLHTKWKYRSGGGRCENCYHHLPLYLFRCGDCQMLSCNRCRRNRL